MTSTETDRLRWSRDELIAADIIHDEDHARNRRRLDALYGDVARAQNAFIASHVRGSVLDVGAGYGNLVRALLDAGLAATGVEIDEEKIARAREWFDVELRRADFATLTDERFGTVIFREALNHLPLKESLEQAYALATQRCLVFQGSEILALRIAKHLYGHHEHDQKTPASIVAGMRAAGFKNVRVLYRDTLAFPLSGGWWGRDLVPVSALRPAVLRADAAATSLARRLGVAPWTCFRVLVIGEKP